MALFIVDDISVMIVVYGPSCDQEMDQWRRALLIVSE